MFSQTFLQVLPVQAAPKAGEYGVAQATKPGYYPMCIFVPSGPGQAPASALHCRSYRPTKEEVSIWHWHPTVCRITETIYAMELTKTAEERGEDRGRRQFAPFDVGTHDNGCKTILSSRCTCGNLNHNP